MAKYRAWVAQVMEMKEFKTEAEARKAGMAMRDKWVAENPSLELYFEVDDCGTEEEDE
jgi:hypothetical protein